MKPGLCTMYSGYTVRRWRKRSPISADTCASVRSCGQGASGLMKSIVAATATPIVDAASDEQLILFRRQIGRSLEVHLAPEDQPCHSNRA